MLVNSTILISKIQLVVYYQYCVLIGSATTTLYNPLITKSAGFLAAKKDYSLALTSYSCFVSIFLTN